MFDHWCKKHDIYVFLYTQFLVIHGTLWHCLLKPNFNNLAYLCNTMSTMFNSQYFYQIFNVYTLSDYVVENVELFLMTSTVHHIKNMIDNTVISVVMLAFHFGFTFCDICVEIRYRSRFFFWHALSHMWITAAPENLFKKTIKKKESMHYHLFNLRLEKLQKILI